jgi:hypothetical protein
MSVYQEENRNTNSMGGWRSSEWGSGVEFFPVIALERMGPSGLQGACNAVFS